MTKNIKACFSLFIITAFILVNGMTSCTKRTEVFTGNEHVAKMNGAGTQLLHDILFLTDQVLYTGSYADSCALISVDTTGMQDTVLIDFGGGCLCSDGYERSGIISINFPGSLYDSLSPYTIDGGAYSLDQSSLTGLIQIIPGGLDNFGLPVFHVVYEGNMNHPAWTGPYLWEADLTRKWTDGFLTDAFGDNEYSWTGRISGSYDAAGSWHSEIIQEFAFNANCSIGHPQSGGLETQLDNGEVQVLDYGTGACDSSAALWSGAQWRTIALP